MQDDCKQIQNKVNRIEGQVVGIKRMISEGRTTEDVLTQISAVKSALSSLAVAVLRDESSKCFDCLDEKEKQDKFENLVKSFFKVS